MCTLIFECLYTSLYIYTYTYNLDAGYPPHNSIRKRPIWNSIRIVLQSFSQSIALFLCGGSVYPSTHLVIGLKLHKKSMPTMHPVRRIGYALRYLVQILHMSRIMLYSAHYLQAIEFSVTRDIFRDRARYTIGFLSPDGSVDMWVEHYG